VQCSSTSDDVADGDGKMEGDEKIDVDVKEPEKKQTVTSELKKLQFYGAGPKAAVPDVTDSANGEDTGNI